MSMDLPDLGRFPGRVVQYAYVVENMDSALRTYVDLLGVGPWFVWGPFTPPQARYRGRTTGLTITLARCFMGETMIELIQQHDDGPSVYREVVEQRGYGFHHFAIATSDADRDIARFEASGFPVVFEDVVPSGVRVTYVDTRAALPGMLEILEMNPEMEDMYRRFRAAAVDWDGNDPIRSG